MQMEHSSNERQSRLDQYQGYFRTYLDLVPESDFQSMLYVQLTTFPAYLIDYSPERQGYAYAEGKWTPKTILQHITDTERIMAYRALCIARGETQQLPGFDENAYADKALAERRDWSDIISEWRHVRNASLHLFASFNDEMLLREGHFSGRSLSVEGLGCLIAGHLQHHYRVLEERYRI